MKKGQGQKLVAAGAALMIAEPALALAHTGGTGVIVGLAAGAIAYLAADEIHQAKAGASELEEPVAPKNKKPVAPGKGSLAYRLLNGKSVRGDADDQPQPPHGLPRRSPTFAQMKHLIRPGRDILGFDGQKCITAVPFSQSVNIAIIGMPRRGKTTCLRFHMAQGLMRHAIIRGWDTHGDVAGEFGDYLAIAESVDEVLADCAWIERELARRAALYKRCRRHDPQAEREWSRLREILYIIDEFLLLSAVELKTKPERDLVTNTLLSLIAGASKYKVRVILSGQALPASLFGDQGTAGRDIISTRYAFASEDRQAQMIGIDAKAIKELMPLIAGEDIQGYAILAGGPLVTNTIISIPETTFEDIQELLAERAADGEEDELEPNLPEGITAWHLEQIVQAHAAGWPLEDIAALVHMDMRMFQTACELAGIDVTPAPAPKRAEPVLLTKKTRKATRDDAVEVWNACGGGIGRPRLQKELRARGLECSDYLAGELLSQILQELQAGGGDGDVAVGDD